MHLVNDHGILRQLPDLSAVCKADNQYPPIRSRSHQQTFVKPGKYDVSPMHTAKQMAVTYTKGIGIKTMARPPSRDEAPGMLRRAYICDAKRGKPAPKADRMTVFAARAEAANNTSMRCRYSDHLCSDTCVHQIWCREKPVNDAVKHPLRHKTHKHQSSS